MLQRDWYASGAEEFDGEVAALRSWLLARLAWMDSVLAATAASGGGTVASAAPAPTPEAGSIEAAGR